MGGFGLRGHLDPFPGGIPGPGGKYSNRNNGLRLLNALRRGGGAQGDKSVAFSLGQPAIGEPSWEKPGNNRIKNKTPSFSTTKKKCQKHTENKSRKRTLWGKSSTQEAGTGSGNFRKKTLEKIGVRKISKIGTRKKRLYGFATPMIGLKAVTTAD